MDDEELLKLARQAGWQACDDFVKEKLIAFGRLVVRRKNQRIWDDRYNKEKYED